MSKTERSISFIFLFVIQGWFNASLQVYRLSGSTVSNRLIRSSFSSVTLSSCLYLKILRLDLLPDALFGPLRGEERERRLEAEVKDHPHAQQSTDRV